jgi:hypothetical protein
MATQVLTNALVLVNAVDLSDHVKQVELSQSVDMQDVTAMGADTKLTKPGLKDWTLKITFHQDYAGSKVDATISPLIGTTTTFEVRPVNAARSATNPGWTGTGSISSYNPVAGGVGDEQLAAVTIEAASSLVRNIV